MTFDEVIGQKEAQERLKQMVSEDRLPHALMFCGPMGAGKMALAIAFGCYLLSKKTDYSEYSENSYYRTSTMDSSLIKRRNPETDE